MSEPSKAPFVSLANPDGSWFCPGCRSLNRARSSRCYSCQAASPFVAPGTSGIPAHKLLAAVLVGSLVVLGLGGSMVLSRAASRATSASAPASLVAIVPADTVSPTPDLTSTPPPSDSPTATPSITPAPSIVPPPTATPRATTLAPTTKSTPKPTPKPTRVPSDGTVPLPSFPVSVSGATIAWFSVSGDNPGSLIASDQVASKAACDLDSLACFYDSYKWSYADSTDPKSGVCKITSVSLIATYTITLPRWSAPARVPPALVDWWGQVLVHFVWHESQHLAIAQSYAPSIKAAIAAGPCADAGSIAAAKAAMVPLQEAQAAFDAAQRVENWQWPPYSGPWN